MSATGTTSRPPAAPGLNVGPLAGHVLRKLITVIPLLWGVVTLIFVLIELSPGTAVDKYITPDTDPVIRELLIQKFGLDQPGWWRYLLMLGNVARFDFGVSLDSQRPVFDIVREALPNTVVLAMLTLATAYPVGIAIGTFQATRAGRLTDTVTSVTSLFFYSMPGFWLAMMLQLLFAYQLDLLPTSGLYDVVYYDDMSTLEAFRDRAMHLVLPGVMMGIAGSAGIARYMRSSLLEVVRQDFIRTARAKGLPERVVIGKHALRNALLPIITLMGLSLPGLFGGSVLIETIFAWPGMGRVIVTAIYAQDTPLLIACFYVFALLVVSGNLLADLLYAVADPRIRLK